MSDLSKIIVNGESYNIKDSKARESINDKADKTELKNYLPLSGGTMSNTEKVENLNADMLDGVHVKNLMMAQGTFDNSIDLDYGEGTITLDPPSGTLPENALNISILSIGESFTRRKQLAFLYNNDNIYYRRRVDEGWKNWRKLAFTDSIVESAKKLSTPITLWGQSFDGSRGVDGNIILNYGRNDRGAIVSPSGSLFHVCPTDGDWSCGMKILSIPEINDENIIGTAAGAYGRGKKIQWYYYGGPSPDSALVYLKENKMGVGVFTPQYLLHVGGNICATEKSIAAAHETSSDIRLKSNIIDKEVSLTDIANAPVIDYTMKVETPVVKEESVDSVDAEEQTVAKKVRTSSINSTTAESTTADDTVQEVEVAEMQCTGSTAQYWKEILPNCVSEGKDGMYSMQYGNIALVSVISLAREVAALKETVKTLNERVEELEKKNI